MSKHTPGPWLVGEHRIGLDGDASEIDVVSKGDSHGDHSICTVDEAWEGCIEANARLISAAPDMLEALKKMTFWADLSPANDWIETEAKAAIAKATGESE